MPFALILAALMTSPPEPQFAHARLEGRMLHVTNGLNVTVEPITDALRAVGPDHRRDQFNDRPYEISLAAFVGNDGAVMVHAERVEDGSGASNYDGLPAATWPASDFRKRTMCVAVSAEDVAGEHDLRWLRDRGFDPSGELALEQAFLTTPDHNNEMIITLAAKVPDCDDAGAVAAALERLRAQIRVTR